MAARDRLTYCICQSWDFLHFLDQKKVNILSSPPKKKALQASFLEKRRLILNALSYKIHHFKNMV